MNIHQAKRVCFFAHYDPNDRVGAHVIHYLREIRLCGFWIVVITTSNLDAEQQSRILRMCDELIIRDNINLDWGGWHEAYQRYPDIKPDLLLFSNDSVYGPIWSLKSFIEELTCEPADLYGAVGSTEIMRHIQSWFLLLTPPVYDHPAFKKLFGNPFPDGLSKWQIIEIFEMLFSNELLSDMSLKVRLAYDPQQFKIQVKTPFNASQVLWAELIEARRVPFVKKEILRDNPKMVKSVNKWIKTVNSANPYVVKLIEADCKPSKSSFISRFKANFYELNEPYRPFNKVFLRIDFLYGSGSLLGKMNYLLYRLLNKIFDRLTAVAPRSK